ncbi:MAG: hypothetical protein IKQ10_02490 [Oscillospiraceae bacterium]|nr:hypothetical protein [Oscillospiraceae bacterium]
MRKKALLFGFAALFLCGIGDWLIGYDPPGGENLIFGISNTAIAGLPTWFYILSLGFGILSGFGCMAFAPAMLEVLDELGVSRETKAYRAFRFGLASAPMMFVSFHAACCIVLLLIQAALRAGLDVHAADDVFLLPAAASLLPFVVWCFLCDIPVTAAFIVLVLKGRLALPKAAVVCCPMGMSLTAKLIGAILLAANSKYAFLTACGESWGWAFMCLAFYAASKAKR